jgi:formate/nitrite transporter FocA (FNT family)
MNQQNLLRTVLPLAMLAGICISIGCVVNLRVGGVAGAALFAFGLTTVVYYGLKLYTGTAGFIRRQGDWSMLTVVLLGNIVGCLAVALIARCSPMPLQETAQGVLEGRLAVGPLKGGVLAIGCGFIMTTAVTFAHQGKNLPLLFGVPLFIMCGFPHCVADAFYYLCVPLDFWSAHTGEILLFYLSIVLGNFIGCNLYRAVMPAA